MKGGGHMCPGCLVINVPHSRLACRDCWSRLPADLRGEVEARYRNSAGSPAHTDAVRAAIDWYRENRSS